MSRKSVRKPTREDRLEITITKWGRKVIVHSRKAGSTIHVSKDKYTATIEFLDDENRGLRSN